MRPFRLEDADEEAMLDRTRRRQEPSIGKTCIGADEDYRIERILYTRGDPASMTPSTAPGRRNLGALNFSFERYTAMVEVPNAPVPPHPVAPAGACAGDAEDAAAAADLAATGVQTGSRSCSRSWATTAS
jgi:hypothetical protein